MSIKGLSKLESLTSPPGAQYGIVVARWNSEVTEPLLEGAVSTLKAHGVSEKHIHVYRVPGTYELPIVAGELAQSDTIQSLGGAVICLGAVIKGDTDHDKYINNSVSEALQVIALETGVPIMFGVLTCNTQQQALDRAGGPVGNKGVEAAEAAIETLNVLQRIREEQYSAPTGS
ncbi:6,7-dimethyl-8-ribityllumazine synthase [Calycomorphotria hydatis]|uniref:6,7-dimethyl-8-ribityllumazine synthase n=1 Tax=Calycomorphotria hydatis TaxID=2528027 RepID=A0A517TD39_9PLAN|nr:6,7-dimethyl-8-ribityllumazine synthase [Calycomorphotria hydatis]QDT66285.1 6,7-dimethyl-8-ribityllumazine synthase [Calycomorphotria hydatis]